MVFATIVVVGGVVAFAMRIRMRRFLVVNVAIFAFGRVVFATVVAVFRTFAALFEDPFSATVVEAFTGAAGPASTGVFAVARTAVGAVRLVAGFQVFTAGASVLAAGITFTDHSVTITAVDTDRAVANGFRAGHLAAKAITTAAGIRKASTIGIMAIARFHRAGTYRCDNAARATMRALPAASAIVLMAGTTRGGIGAVAVFRVFVTGATMGAIAVTCTQIDVGPIFVRHVKAFEF